MTQSNIQKLLSNKIEALHTELENAQSELKKWQEISADYDANPGKFDLLATLLVTEQTETKKSRKK
ncbi:hypothetical protein [Pedobacter nototheniae]|uniref:hypothetical protein n=1 Tax=Pedobacter nototheniae TaxID=2488994 RepID=UPI00103F0097|nr:MULTISPECIES: hypothetical protein [Pedobacter]